ncbi:MAG: hypothetical protein R3Y06_00035 [Faecalibacterium sp.]
MQETMQPHNQAAFWSNRSTVAQARAELIKQTQYAMMSHQDSGMWAVCEGVLEKADQNTAHAAVLEGDIPAGEVLNKYIAHLEDLLEKTDQ